MGYRDIILEEDLTMVIKAIQHWPKRMEWRIHRTTSKIIDVCNDLESWEAFILFEVQMRLCTSLLVGSLPSLALGPNTPQDPYVQVNHGWMVNVLDWAANPSIRFVHIALTQYFIK
ncbi:hypothetical protein CJ030_MR5G021743 [Morella rubra]|uniref:Uncharacterized protein n=1 Tax=Morella rubra TaxID=262757 RepID=A0A6A1VKN1_9ROSI|nr:hypothetical protein CJ030_MR5G021742 [Morella rubra]KAB1213165.1 hypothetical protein CJ030_MR5G021743 [Morella rubra]